MRTITYLAVFEPIEEGFGVFFPDLPGCVSMGKDFFVAHEMAQEALSLHLYGMEKDGEVLPKPSIDLEVDPETAPGYLVVPVTVYPDIFQRVMESKKTEGNDFVALVETAPYKSKDTIL